MLIFSPGHTFKNYKDACRQLEMKPCTNGKDKARQEAYWAEHFTFIKQGHKYIILQMLKPFTPYRPENKMTAMHLKPLILHELTETLLNRGTTTYYKLAREFVLPRADAYVMFGLASPLWREMKGGNAPLDITNTEQRRAYFEHRSVCYDKLQSAIDSLIHAKLIWQDEVVIVKEQIKIPDQIVTNDDGTVEEIPAHLETIVRYARTEEENDFRDVVVKTFMALNALHPERKKPFVNIADVWLSHKEEEYNHIQRQLIETEINDKATIHLPEGFRKVIAFFPALRLAFDPETLQKAFTQLSQAEIYSEQQSLKRKLISWYEVRFESEKSIDVQCCLYDIVGDIEHE